jgi:septum formation protein
VRVPDADELTEGDPETVAVENARRKAEAAAAAENPGATEAPPGEAGESVLGVDTVVCIGSSMYDKPISAEQARATLHALSGREHAVISGLCLIENGRARTASATTRVEFRDLDPGLIEWYVAGEEWRERAGGYAIQGRGAALVRRIEGDYLNVVGLPVSSLLQLAPWLLGAPGV